MDSLRSAGCFTPGPHDALVAKHAAANGVPEQLVHRIIRIESRGNAAVINAGNYDDEAAWSFSVEDGDKLLGPSGDNWGAYADMHLGEDTSAAQKTKARWKYPFGKEGKVYGAALRSIRSRASQQGATAIFDEAGRLLDLIETKEGDNPADPEEKPASRSTIVPFARRRATAQASGYRVVRGAAGDSAEIYLYGQIGGGGFFSDGTEITAAQFRRT